MPGAFRASGLGLAFLQIILACVVNYVSSSCLLYTSFEWGCFSYSGLALNCSSRWFTKFVDFIFFVNVYGTTLSYSVLIQGNLVSSFGFIRSKYWTNMPFILDDEDSIFWVIVFSVAAVHGGLSAATGDQATAEESDDILVSGLHDDHLPDGRHHRFDLQRRHEQLLFGVRQAESVRVFGSADLFPGVHFQLHHANQPAAVLRRAGKADAEKNA